jgi:hypothetical protein
MCNVALIAKPRDLVQGVEGRLRDFETQMRAYADREAGLLVEIETLRTHQQVWIVFVQNTTGFRWTQLSVLKVTGARR